MDNAFGAAHNHHGPADSVMRKSSPILPWFARR
jgi:hypothetical protein